MRLWRFSQGRRVKRRVVTCIYGRIQCIGNIGGVFSKNHPLATNKEVAVAGFEYTNQTNSEIPQLRYQL